ncbi:hypothetical protein UAJ10_10865 [Nitrospirillum sp. BR 11164]|uniref:hypothetical protein n=1 Tax=Nitrospirillum sp. BR 11164 TaxID=3104324 RepID=UPI002AFEA260|nr:hypothetical protein [Nitrospirillum sp. BR 11164]MEA1649514.1 hypothetical protein [Nitrospirillum sp. BR 11164]
MNILAHESLAHDTLARDAYARSALANSPLTRLGPLLPSLVSIGGGLALLALRNDPRGAGGVEMAAYAIAALAGLAATRRRLRGAAWCWRLWPCWWRPPPRWWAWHWTGRPSCPRAPAPWPP